MLLLIYISSIYISSTSYHERLLLLFFLFSTASYKVLLQCLYIALIVSGCGRLIIIHSVITYSSTCLITKWHLQILLLLIRDLKRLATTLLTFFTNISINQRINIVYWINRDVLMNIVSNLS